MEYIFLSWPHVRIQIKSQQIEESWNNTSCILSDHHGLKLNINSNTKEKVYKLMKIEKLNTKWKTSQEKNHEGNEKLFRIFHEKW